MRGRMPGMMARTTPSGIHTSRGGKTHDGSAAALRPPRRRMQEAAAGVAADSAAHRRGGGSFERPAPMPVISQKGPACRRQERMAATVARPAPMRRSVSEAAAVSGSGTLNNRGNNGYYWSGTENDSSNAWNANFNSNNANANNRNNKNNGFAVRLFASETAGFCLPRAFFLPSRAAAPHSFPATLCPFPFHPVKIKTT
ncbi:hypothetical protein ACMYZ5_10995 [Bacteroides sp. KG68]|uniref:hypothetical protein n=1 Tax=unclassified Bacteroides TaxID=2646097 RepID=UPI003D96F3B5